MDKRVQIPVVRPNINSPYFHFPLKTECKFILLGQYSCVAEIDPNFITLLKYGALSSLKMYGPKVCSRPKVGVTCNN